VVLENTSEEMKDTLPMVSIITVNYNGKKFLKDCLQSLSDMKYPKSKLEIFMVDNGSQDGSIDYVRKNFSSVKIILNKENNYAKANNLGIRVAKGEFIAFINNDVKVDKNWLIALVNTVKDDDSIGAAGSRILLMDGKLESMGHQELPNFYWSDKTSDDHGLIGRSEEAVSLSGCAVLYRRSALEEVGYFDEDFNMYMEDVDISLRMRKKRWKLVYAPESFLRHIHHGTSLEDAALFYTERNRLLLIAKHYPENLCSALLGKGYFTAQKDLSAQGSLYALMADLVAKLIKHHKIDIARGILGDLFAELKKVSNYENNILVQRLTEFSRVIESKEDFIRSKDTQIISLDQEIAQRSKALEEKDTQITGLSQEVGQRDAALKEKDVQIINLDQEIAQRNKALEEKDTQIISLYQEIGQRNAALKEKDTQITGLSQHLNSKDKDIDDLKLRLLQKEKILKDIYNSTAFRYLVRPLWAVLWRAKQILRSLGLFKASSQESSGAQAKNEQVSFDISAQENDVGICTIISKNYLAHARVLAESFLEHNKGRVFVLLTDKPEDGFDLSKEKFSLIRIDDIKDKIPDFEKFCFQYNITEFNTAVKPFFLEYLFEKFKIKKIIFFDPDILVTHDVNHIFRLLDQFSIILTPHITQPFHDNIKPMEVHILKSGIYNLGFLALSFTDTTKKMLEWWKERLKRYCVSDVENGLFVDQKWMDFMPGFFEDVYILRDKSYNIAYWNYHYRKVRIENEKVLVEDKPVRFLHFSGFDPSDLNSVSRHQDRFRLKDLKIMQPIFELYKDKLVAQGYNEVKNLSCVFDYFSNGIKIPDIARRIYWELTDAAKVQFGNPFEAGIENSYFNWLNEALDARKPMITRLMEAVYKDRSDVQLHYRDILNSDRQSFIRWFLISAKREYQLDNAFLMSPDSKSTEFVWMGLKPKIVYKSRNMLRVLCKKLFSSNLHIISKLRTAELRLYKKIGKFQERSKESAEDLTVLQKRKGLNVLGYINAEHGVGEAVRANILSLKAAGLEVSLNNVTPTYIRQNDSSFPALSSSNPFLINLIHINADEFPRMCLERGENYFKNKYKIGFWTWELSDFPDEWQESFTYCDEIWVPSSFTLASISKKSRIPVIKISHAVSVDKIKNVQRSYFGLKEKDFIFLFIFDFLSYFERKNPLAVIQAFERSFSPSEDVKLVIKCCNSSFDPSSMKRLMDAAKGYNIDIIDKYLFREEINALISLCDSYVSLHRCEGFGLTMAEAMFLGKPVIATGYSGNTDFMNIGNSYLVSYKLIPIHKDVGPYGKGGMWAEPNIEHATELMKYVYENKTKAQEIGKIASDDIKKCFNLDVIGHEIKNRIDYIYANLK
jgi:GT2 family glycosyltransferase/glycosyltransferase involved in cell wall biosynthesis